MHNFPVQLALLLLLTACASQAPSTLQRGTFIPPPPAPVRPGVGAPVVGQPGQVNPQEVPRSPHKRVLPPTREPGLWAGDSAPRTSSGPQREAYILEVPLPEPKEAPEGGSTSLAGKCAGEMNAAISPENMRKIWRLSLKERRCLVAHLYYYCTSVRYDRLLVLRRRGQQNSEKEHAHYKGTSDGALQFLKDSCDDVDMEKLDDPLEEISEVWRTKK